MAEPPPELSFTPPGTPLSTAPHYYQVDSMDLVDPEGARTPKRQRVDSGSGAHENLSIEAASNLPSTSTPSVVPATNVNLNLNSNSNHIQSPTSPTSTRPSKVTINMKSPNGEMNDSPNSPSPTPLAASHRQSSPDTTPAPNNPNSNAASLFSSTEASPQIEIADPEDMGQDPNTSNWRPLEDVVTGDPQADPIDISDVTPLVDLFPIRGTLSAYDTLRRMAQLFEHGEFCSQFCMPSIAFSWIDILTKLQLRWNAPCILLPRRCSDLVDSLCAKSEPSHAADLSRRPRILGAGTSPR